jgi:hypothetical protein
VVGVSELKRRIGVGAGSIGIDVAERHVRSFSFLCETVRRHKPNSILLIMRIVGEKTLHPAAQLLSTSICDGTANVAPIVSCDSSCTSVHYPAVLDRWTKPTSHHRAGSISLSWNLT